MQRKFDMWTNNIDFIGNFFPVSTYARGVKIGSQNKLVLYSAYMDWFCDKLYPFPI